MYFSLGAKCRLDGMMPEMVLGMMVIVEVFRENNCNLTLSHAADGRHSRGSLHYTGGAVDLHWGIKSGGMEIAEELRDRLGPCFDVVHGTEGHKTHFHVEYQPKKGLNI